MLLIIVVAGAKSDGVRKKCARLIDKMRKMNGKRAIVKKINVHRTAPHT